LPQHTRFPYVAPKIFACSEYHHRQPVSLKAFRTHNCTVYALQHIGTKGEGLYQQNTFRVIVAIIWLQRQLRSVNAGLIGPGSRQRPTAVKARPFIGRTVVSIKPVILVLDFGDNTTKKAALCMMVDSLVLMC